MPHHTSFCSNSLTQLLEASYICRRCQCFQRLKTLSKVTLSVSRCVGEEFAFTLDSFFFEIQVLNYHVILHMNFYYVQKMILFSLMLWTLWISTHFHGHQFPVLDLDIALGETSISFCFKEKSDTFSVCSSSPISPNGSVLDGLSVGQNPKCSMDLCFQILNQPRARSKNPCKNS